MVLFATVRQAAVGKAYVQGVNLRSWHTNEGHDPGSGKQNKTGPAVHSRSAPWAPVVTGSPTPGPAQEAALVRAAAARRRRPPATLVRHSHHASVDVEPGDISREDHHGPSSP